MALPDGYFISSEIQWKVIKCLGLAKLLEAPWLANKKTLIGFPPLFFFSPPGMETPRMARPMVRPKTSRREQTWILRRNNCRRKNSDWPPSRTKQGSFTSWLKHRSISQNHHRKIDWDFPLTFLFDYLFFNYSFQFSPSFYYFWLFLFIFWYWKTMKNDAIVFFCTLNLY